MTVQAVLFDLYGTLIDIETDEGDLGAYQTIAHYLALKGIEVKATDIRTDYASMMATRRKNCPELYPEVDVQAIWQGMLSLQNHLSPREVRLLARDLTALYRRETRRRLQLYDGVVPLLYALKERYRLGLISDAQRLFALPEMDQLQIRDFFDVRIISSDYGFRKPDPRLFTMALQELNVQPSNAVYVGNDIYRDVYGAKRAGLLSIYVDSGAGTTRTGCEDVHPDYYTKDVKEVVQGLAALSSRYGS